jgi:hypothetical protein
MEQCCGHMLVLRSFRTRKECKASASRFKSRTDWAKSDPLAHDRARRQGWMEYCCAHMAAPRHPFTREECVASARKYKTRSAWARGEGGSYNAARNNGWLDECCAHMPPPKKGPTPRRDWTKEECKASALRFKTRKRWYEGDQRTYAAAYRNGWLDECCAHMGPPIKGRPRKP